MTFRHMADDRIIATSGSTFLISSQNGDLNPKTVEGFYSRDTRFLSIYKILINGREIESVGVDSFDHSIVSFYSVSREMQGTVPLSLTIVRDRLVGDAFHEDINIMNDSMVKMTFLLEAVFDSDFADVFEVRRGSFKKVGRTRIEHRVGQNLCFVYRRKEFRREVWISFNVEPVVKGGRIRFQLTLAPKTVWKTCVNVVPVLKEGQPPPATCVGTLLGSPFGPYRRDVSRPLTQTKQKPLGSGLPQLHTDNTPLREGYFQAISDLQLLQLERVPDQYILAAGLPWFMTVFGRDSIISAIQTKLLGTRLLTGTLGTLATLQAKTIDKFSEAQPGKMPHEVRHGELSIFEKIPQSSYYGSVDSTPLYLMLLSEAYQWTGDQQIVKEYIGTAESCLNWIDEYGDSDDDLFVEYIEKGKGGLRNQGWKDSEDSISFATGELAEPPIALSEVQGYVYAAKSRMADLYALLGRVEKAKKLKREAILLKRKFNRDFWMPDKQYYAIALDGKKNRVDSISSNPGQCLWTGIVDDDKAPMVVKRLLSDDMFTGWGIRTLSSEMKRYDPLSYHNGTVWPHDTSIIASGMLRYGFFKEANIIALSLLDAAVSLPLRRLPELFSGYVRREESKPIPYPAANSPQAWASGAFVYCLETLLGIARSGDHLMQQARPAGTSLSLSGVMYRGVSLVL